MRRFGRHGSGLFSRIEGAAKHLTNAGAAAEATNLIRHALWVPLACALLSVPPHT